MNKPNIAFFGGEPLGTPALKALLDAGIRPDLVICSPDRPAGRGHKLTAPQVKKLAEAHNIPTYQPASYKDDAVKTYLTSESWDLFIVVAYNFILPNWLLDLPARGSLNLHPSLLPALRGASPIRSAILQDEPENLGVSVMLLDEEMDHGPVLTQKPFTPNEWPMRGLELDVELAELGSALLANTIPKWLRSDLQPTEQNHDKATYTKRFKKGDNEISLDPTNLPTGTAAKKTLSKIYAWHGIGDTFFIHKGTRVKIKDATLEKSGALHLLTVIPENKQPMSFSSYLQSLTAV